MKKIIALLLVILAVFCFVSCNSDEEESSKKVYDDTLPENGYTVEDILENLENAGFDMDEVVVRDKIQCEEAAEFADVRDACDGRILFYIEAEDPNGGFVFIYGMQKLEDLPKVKSIVAGTKMEEEILNKSFKNVIAIGTKIRTVKAVFGDDVAAIDGSGYSGDMIVENLTDAEFDDVVLYGSSEIYSDERFADVVERYSGKILFCVEGYNQDNDYVFVFGTTVGANLDELRSAAAFFGPADGVLEYANAVAFCNGSGAAEALGEQYLSGAFGSK